MTDKNPDTLGLDDPVTGVKLEDFLDRLTESLGQILAANRADMEEHRERWTSDSGLRAAGISLLVWVTVWPFAAGLAETAGQVEEMGQLVRLEIADSTIMDGITLPDAAYGGVGYPPGMPLRDRMISYMMSIWIHLRVPFLREKLTELLGEADERQRD